MFHYKFVERWPKVVDIGQAVLNRKLEADISEMEGLVTMHNLHNSEPNWDVVEKTS